MAGGNKNGGHESCERRLTEKVLICLLERADRSASITSTRWPLRDTLSSRPTAIRFSPRSRLPLFLLSIRPQKHQDYLTTLSCASSPAALFSCLSPIRYYSYFERSHLLLLTNPSTCRFTNGHTCTRLHSLFKYCRGWALSLREGTLPLHNTSQ